jgi:hypothetical protein
MESMDRQRTTVWIDRGLWRQAKSHAALAGITLSEWLDKAVLSELSREEVPERKKELVRR